MTAAVTARGAEESAVARGAVLGGDIRQVVASGARLGVVQGNDVLLLTSAGEVLGRLDRQPTPAFTRSAQGRGLGADEILDLQGIDDDDLESDEVEEALDLEGTAARPAGGPARARRANRSAEAGGGAAPVLAGGGGGQGAIWAATGAGLWRADADQPAATSRWPAAPVGPRGLSLGAMAAAESGPILAGLAGDRLLRSSDGGASWTLLAVLTSPARAIELSRDGGEVFVLDDEGVAEVAHHQRLPIFAGRASHLARCGNELLILADDGLYAWSWEGGVERRSGRLPARRLGCSPAAPQVTMAIGSALLLSRDGGRTWAERDDLPMLDIQSAALTADRIWIGTAAGLFQAPLDDPRPALVRRAAGDADTDAGSPGFDAGAVKAIDLSSATPRLWHALLPRISLVFAADTTRDLTAGKTTETAVWLLLTFPLARPRLPSQTALELGRQRARRRMASVAELTWLAAAGAGVGASRDEEAAAETRALLDSLEDLR